MFYAAMVMKESPNSDPIDTGDNGYDVAGKLPKELPKEIVERLEDLQRHLGRLEGRVELTQDIETTLREQLKHERERADRLEAELREAEAEIHAVEAALYNARRGWFKRFFGIGEIQR
jgi:chromosome segregation ATPase